MTIRVYHRLRFYRNKSCLTPFNGIQKYLNKLQIFPGSIRATKHKRPAIRLAFAQMMRNVSTFG